MLDSSIHEPTDTVVRSNSYEGRGEYLDRSGRSLRGERSVNYSRAFQTGNNVLNALPASTIGALWPSLRRIHVEREQFLFQQDEDLQYLYFPETAVMKLWRSSETGAISCGPAPGIVTISGTHAVVKSRI